MLGRAGGLRQAACDEQNEEAEAARGVKTRPGAAAGEQQGEEQEEDEEEQGPAVAVGNADTETSRARRVSTARAGLGDVVAPHEMEEGDRQEDDLGICDNSPTNPGALLGGKS